MSLNVFDLFDHHHVLSRDYSLLVLYNKSIILNSVYRKRMRTIMFFVPPGGGGILGILSDGDDRMEPKVETKKIPRASSKIQRNHWTKN